jgi:hypothetical protein
LSSRQSLDSTSPSGLAYSAGTAAPGGTLIRNVALSQSGTFVAFNGHQAEIWADKSVWDVEHAAPARALEPPKSNSFVTLAELERLCQQEPTEYLVEGLLPANDVHVAVGDSGLGKTPWAYQLGLCVAAGKPFLGHSVRKAKVLYYDLENGPEEILNVGRTLCGHLQIPQFPSDFLVLSSEGNPLEPQAAVERYRPQLVIIDTLRALRPEAESGNDRMGDFLQKLRTTARSNRCAILLLHHIRKPGKDGVPQLEYTPVLQWLQQASGARALINQTNTRIAFDAPWSVSEAAVVMKSFVKMKGESGPVFIERVLDGTSGEPIGYKRIVGCQLLGHGEQEAAFDRLPQKQFTFKEAKSIYGRSDDPTKKWLDKCIAAGLIRQVSRGIYEKL